MKTRDVLFGVMCGMLAGGCGSAVASSMTETATGSTSGGAEGSSGGELGTTASASGGASASTTTTTTTSASTSTSTSTSDGGSSGSGSETTGSSGHTVSGAVTRSVEPAPGNDAIGDIYLAIVDECSFSYQVVVGAVVNDGDLSAPMSEVDFSIDGVPDGSFYLVAFLDDNGDADTSPGPDSGDLGASDGFGIGCTPFAVAGGDVAGVDIDLNYLFP